MDKIREVEKLRSNRSTTKEMKQEILISRVPSKGFAAIPMASMSLLLRMKS